MSTGHHHGHLANVSHQAEVHLIQRAWGQWMAGAGGKILVDIRESGFLQDQGVDEGGILSGIWVSKQCHSAQAILISHLLFGGLSVEICRDMCICICLCLSTCENQLLRCYQATVTELSRSAAAPTSSRAGPPGRLSQKNSTACVSGDSAAGKYTLVYISFYRAGVFALPAPHQPTQQGMLAAGEGTWERKQDVLPYHAPGAPTAPSPRAGATGGNPFSLWTNLTPSQASKYAAVMGTPEMYRSIGIAC